jgi:hypothetical protein
MKTNITVVLFLLFANLQAIRAFTVTRNTILTIGKQTQLKISNLDLQNDGILIGDTASLLIISNTQQAKITGNNFSLASLKIAGNVAVETPIISVNNDLIMQSGVMNIGENHIIIYGDLLGENEHTYVTASTGAIILEREETYLPAGQMVNLLGLNFVPMNDVHNFTLTRSHSPVIRNGRVATSHSAKRVFEFCSPLDIFDVHKQLLPHEINGVSKPTLFVQDFEDWKKVKSRKDEFYAVTRISMFSPDPDGLHFPKVISPDEMSNNKFEIIGLDNYPNARLIIISKAGHILYDIYPYRNNFTGQSLLCGTYYYMFSEYRDSEPIKKSFFEIVR